MLTAGAKVVCVDISEEAARDTVDQVRQEGGVAFVEVADVGNASLIEPVVRRAQEAMGGQDGLVLNVCVFNGLALDKITVESGTASEYAVNLRSKMLFAQAAVALMEQAAHHPGEDNHASSLDGPPSTEGPIHD